MKKFKALYAEHKHFKVELIDGKNCIPYLRFEDNIGEYMGAIDNKRKLKALKKRIDYMLKRLGSK